MFDVNLIRNLMLERCGSHNNLFFQYFFLFLRNNQSEDSN